MNKLIALIAVLSFASSAHAAGGADYSHSGDFRLQYKNDMNADLNEDAADSPKQNWHQRTRLGTTVRAGEKLSAHLGLIHNADWGSNADQTADDIQAGATNNVLIVNEAYGVWVASDSLTLKFGRGGMTMADGRFVSTNDYNNVPKSFDGVLASLDQEFARLNIFGVQGAKANTTPAGNFNDYGTFFGVSADFKSLPEMIKTAHVHVVQVRRDAGTYEIAGTNTALDKETNMKIGFVLAGEVAGLDWRANYEMEDGENDDGTTKTDISTSMIDAELGYKFGATRAHFGYHTDSGTASGNDNETYNGFHYDTHNNAGLMDILGWGNLTYMRVGATHAMDDLTFGAEYLMFTQTEKQDFYYTTTGSSDANNNGTVDAGEGDVAEDELGTEIDLWVTKKYTNNFNITGRYSMFTPGDEFGTTQEDNHNQLYVEAKLSF
jgi:hypothetical protein